MHYRYASYSPVGYQDLHQQLTRRFVELEPQLFHRAIRMLRTPDDARDAVQDTYLLALVNIGTLRNNDSLSGWLVSILDNTCLMQLRKNSKTFYTDIEISDDGELVRQIEYGVDQLAQKKAIQSAIHQLSQPLQEVILLRYFTTVKEYEHIASVLGIPIGTVRSRLNEAKKILHQVLRNEQRTYNTISSERKEEVRSLFEDSYLNADFDNLINSLAPDILIRFTSGKTEKGRKHIVEMIEDDLVHGSRVIVEDVHLCGDLSIVDGTNLNSLRFPDRCRERTTLVMKRDASYYTEICFHNSAK